MTESEKILEELKKNLGEERLDEIMDSVRSFFSGPGRGARPAQTSSELKRDQQLATVARNPATARVAQDIGLSGIEPKSVTKADPGIASTQATSNRGRFNPGQAARREMENDPQSYNQTLKSLQGNAALKPGEGGLARNRAQQTQTPSPAAPAASEPRDPGTGEKLSSAQDLNRLSNNAQRDPGTGELKSDAKDLSTMSRTQSATRPAPRQAAPAASSAPAQPSRSSQMFQAASDKGDDATSADFFRADRQAQAERKAAPAAKQAPAAPQKPQQSNADYMRSSGMMDEANLERKIRKMFEQKSAKFNPVAADYQDSSGPNKPVGKSEKEQHHGVDEEIIQELGPNRRRKRSVYKTTLGRLEARNWGGNQSTKGRYSEEHTLSEARKAAFKKVEKMKRNRTDTGSFADPIDTEPSKPSMTGY